MMKTKAKTRLRLETLEGREVPAVLVGDPTEAYAWALINHMRMDPAGFANQLDGLRWGTVDSAFGFARTDPVIADLNRLLQYSANPQHYGIALNRLRNAQSVGPLAWDNILADRADGHSDWMKANGFEHTGQDNARKTYIPGFPSTYTGGSPNVWGYEPGQFYWWGENIGYTYGLMVNSKAAYNTGRIGQIGFQQRAAFIDTVSYILEVNSPNFAHLDQLLRSDAAPDGGGTRFNAIGIDIDFFEAPAPYEARDGFPEATISTHRLGLHRPGQSGGYLTGLFYLDANRNGFFDAGEGRGGTLRVTGPVNFTESLNNLQTHGAYSKFVPNGTYTVTLLDEDGELVASQRVVIQNSNAWFEFTPELDLPPETTPPLPLAPTAEDLGVRPSFTWNATDGAVSYEVRLLDRANGNRNLFPAVRVTGTDWVPPADLISGRSYRLMVRPLLATGDGAWATYDFRVAVPEVAATTTVQTLRPVVTWTPVPGATAYHVYVNDLSTGRSNIFPNQLTEGTEWTPPRDLVSGRTYRFIVRALNERGQSVWGVPGRVIIDRPTHLKGPFAAGLEMGPISWSPIEGATYYILLIENVTRGWTTVVRQMTTDTTWKQPIDLIPGHTYRWRVVACNEAGLGTWTLPEFFRLEK